MGARRRTGAQNAGQGLRTADKGAGWHTTGGRDAGGRQDGGQGCGKVGQRLRRLNSDE